MGRRQDPTGEGSAPPRRKVPRAEVSFTWVCVTAMVCATVWFWRWTEPLIAMARNGIDVTGEMIPTFAADQWGKILGGAFVFVISTGFALLWRLLKRTNIVAMLVGRRDEERDRRDVELLAHMRAMATAPAADPEVAALRTELAETTRAMQDREKAFLRALGSAFDTSALPVVAGPQEPAQAPEGDPEPVPEPEPAMDLAGVTAALLRDAPVVAATTTGTHVVRPHTAPRELSYDEILYGPTPTPRTP